MVASIPAGNLSARFDFDYRLFTASDADCRRCRNEPAIAIIGAVLGEVAESDEAGVSQQALASKSASLSVLMWD